MADSHSLFTSEVFSPELRRNSPTSVLTAPLSLKIFTVFGLLVSLYASVWMFVFPQRYTSLGSEMGGLCALFCSSGSLVVCWSAICAYLVRKYNLSPKSCNWAVMPFGLVALPLMAVAFFGQDPSGHLGGAAFFVVTTGSFASTVCRKLAYPTITDKQFMNQERRPPGVF
jgi:hypothetical protein